MIKTKNKKQMVVPGHFVMRDNHCESSSHCGQEIGIVLNKDYYVDIASILTTPVSHAEAIRYGKLLQVSLPNKKMMRLLADNVEIVNNSLLAIGRRDCLILGDVCKKFWTSHSDCEKTDRRGVIFIRPVFAKQ